MAREVENGDELIASYRVAAKPRDTIPSSCECTCCLSPCVSERHAPVTAPVSMMTPLYGSKT